MGREPVFSVFMKLLFTGFEPATEGAESPTSRWIFDLSELAPESVIVRTVLLPATWDGAFAALQPLLGQGWDAVVCLASKRCDQLAIERVAVNENDVSQKDSEGRRPRSKVIVDGGDAGYWTGLPYRELGLRLTERQIASAASHSAGGGLGNHVFYQLMRWIDRSGQTVVGGLVQVPEAAAAIDANKERRRAFLDCIVASVGRSADAADSLSVNVARLQRLKESPTP